MNKDGHAYDLKNGIKEWKTSIKYAMRMACDSRRLDMPLCVDTLFLIPRPKSEILKTRPNPPYWYAGQPDKDNYEKAVLDALEDAKLYVRDSRVATGVAHKIRCGDGCWEPGVQVWVYTLARGDVHSVLGRMLPGYPLSEKP